MASLRLSLSILSLLLFSAQPILAEPAFDVSTGRDQAECAAAIELASGLTTAEIENGSWTTEGRRLADAEILLGRSADGDWLLTSPDHFERLEIDPSWQKTVYWQREASGGMRLVGIINHNERPDYRFQLYAVDTAITAEKFLQGLTPPPPSNIIIHVEIIGPYKRWPYARDILRMSRPTAPIILLSKRSGQVQLIDVMEYGSHRRWMVLTPEAEQDVGHCNLWFR